MLLSLAGLAAGGVYSWTSWIYSYNREAWMNDIQVRQTHDFQYENMQIATHGMSREEVRDRTQAAITKLSNYILVTTLILSLAFEMLVEGQMPDDCADFVLNVYMLCLGSAIFFLVLSILFGVAASNMIYESSAKLLTNEVPPPWPNIDRSMRQRQEHEQTRAFERRPWHEIFLPPLLQSGRWAPSWQRLWSRWRGDGGSAASSSCSRGAALLLGTGMDPDLEGHRAPVLPVGATAAPQSGMGWGQDAEIGAQPTPASRGSTVLLGRVTPAPPTCEPGHKGEGRFGADAPPWQRETMGRCRTPRRKLVRVDSAPQGELDRIEKEYDAQWLDSEQLWDPLKLHSGMCAVLGLRNLLEAYGYLCIATLYGNNGSAWAFWAVQIIFVSLSTLIMEFLLGSLEPWHTLLIAGGPISCAIAATTPWLWLDRILVPLCFISHFLVTLYEGSELMVVEDREEASLSDERAYVRVNSSSLLACHEAQVAAEGNAQAAAAASDFVPQLAPEHLAPSPRLALRAAEASPCVRERQSLETLALVRRLMRSGLFLIRCLWAFSACWALFTAAFTPNGFKNSKAPIGLLGGPPVADLTPLATDWSPYFRPHALVCPKGRVFLADEFRVFELSARRGSVAPYPCDVNGTIADLAADCNETTCWPVVLLEGVPPRVWDCSTNRLRPLLQASGPAQRMAEEGSDGLYVAHGSRIVRYALSERRGGWSPVWAVANVSSGGGLIALDIAGDKLLMFSSNVVQVQDLGSGQDCGTWRLPPEVLGAGCAIEGGSSVLLLGHEDRQGPGVGGLGPRVGLTCADLRARSPHGCGNPSGTGTRPMGCHSLLKQRRLLREGF